MAPRKQEGGPSPRMMHRGFAAWIEVGNRRLAEFDIISEIAKNTMKCWIPSLPNQEFRVCWRDYGGDIDSTGWIFLDGIQVPGRFLFGYGDAERGGYRNGQLTERPFKFQRVPNEKQIRMGGAPVVSPIDNRPVDPNVLGSIIVKIKRVKRTDVEAAGKIQPLPTPAAAPGRTTRIGFGDIQEANHQYPVTWHCEPYDPANPGTYVTFIFKYRTAAFLQSEGIMPWGAEVDMAAPTRIMARPPVDIVQDNAKKSTARARKTKGAFAGVERTVRRGGRTVSGSNTEWQQTDYYPEFPKEGHVVIPERYMNPIEGVTMPADWVFPADMQIVKDLRAKAAEKAKYEEREKAEARKEEEEAKKELKRAGKRKDTGRSPPSNDLGGRMLPVSPGQLPAPPMPYDQYAGRIEWGFREHVKDGSVRAVSSSSVSVLAQRTPSGSGASAQPELYQVGTPGPGPSTRTPIKTHYRDANGDVIMK